MSKTFDKVPHCWLLQSLSVVGISGPLFKWFESYLSNRTQKDVLNGFSSAPLPVCSGVPQGSILGSLLFIIYINSLADLHFSPGSTAILYADDILLYRPLANFHDISVFQQDVNLISDWIESSGPSINPSKNSLLVISRNCVKPQVSVTINGTPIVPVESVWYLGITISSDLRWNTTFLTRASLQSKNLDSFTAIFISLTRDHYASCIRPWSTLSLTTVAVSAILPPTLSLKS